MKDSITKTIIDFLTNRLLILIVFIIFLFYILVKNLFQLQIVEGEDIKNSLTSNVEKTVEIQAQRGEIFDKYGRPLAVNKMVYNLKIDPSIPMEKGELNKVLLNINRVLEENGEEFNDELPITKTKPYEFTFYGANVDRRKEIWLENMGFEYNKKDYQHNTDAMPDANETMEYLIKYFGLIDEDTETYIENISEEEMRKVLSLRSKVHLVRFASHNPVTICLDVSLDTVTKIEEDSKKFRSAYIDTDALRYYPYGKYLSHIVGYIGKISEDDLKNLDEEKYNPATDLIGKTGIEYFYEEDLMGENGTVTVLVNNYGRRVDELGDTRVSPKKGKDIYLTIDAELQKKTYEILEDKLVEVLISTMTGGGAYAYPNSPKDLVSSLIEANNVSVRDIFESSEGTVSYQLKEFIINKNEYIDPYQNEGQKEATKVLAEGIRDDEINVKDGVLLLYEQKIIEDDEEYIDNYINGRISTLSLLINKLEERQITPQMTNLDPSTGNLVILDPWNGDVLAAPSYPSYDANEFITNTSEVYKLYNDPSSPMVNRPFREALAPGSTFKMVTAVAGLESGVIGRNSLIYDEVSFTKAGRPYARCMSSYGHGSINVERAIEVSCNYFFFETAYRMGNAKEGTTNEGIAELNKYMSLFSLDEGSGVEIGEFYSSKENKNLSSLERKRITDERGQEAQWYDGDTIRTAIGQGLNQYTSASMGRMFNIIATKGDNHELHLIQKIVGDEEEYYTPVYKSLDEDVSEDTWDAIHKGMYNVVQGNGTASNIYRGFPIEIGAKTGTAEQTKREGGRPSHTTFGAFAPFDEPEVVVYSTMPFSDTKTATAPAAYVVQDVLLEYFKIDYEPEMPVEKNNITK